VAAGGVPLRKTIVPIKHVVPPANRNRLKKAAPVIKVVVHHPETKLPLLEVSVHDPSLLERVTAWVKNVFEL
jgi:hypothetical protein